MKRSDIYKALRDQAKANFPDLQYIDLEKGQMQRRSDNYPIPLPALLIRIGAINWTSANEGLRVGIVTISLTLHEDLVTDTFDGAEMENETLLLLDKQDELFQAFEGYAVGDFSPLTRVTDQEPKVVMRSISFTTDFKTSIEDTQIIVRKMAKKPQLIIE